MVNIGDKATTHRRATAEGIIRLRSRTVKALRDGEVRKGDPLEVARMAALLAVKSTHNVIPHCHPIPLTAVEVGFEVVKEGVRCSCRVEAESRTGVEMEALHGVCVALLTVWDMVKRLEKDEEGQYPVARITGVCVVEKVK